MFHLDIQESSETVARFQIIIQVSIYERGRSFLRSNTLVSIAVVLLNSLLSFTLILEGPMLHISRIMGKCSKVLRGYFLFKGVLTFIHNEQFQQS